MIKTWKRPAQGLALSIAFAGLVAFAGLGLAAPANAQTAPTLGVQPIAPPGPAPQLPPPTFDQGGGGSSGSSSSRGQSAPLATSAQGCQADIGRISGQRLAAIDALNKLAKANKGKLDPIAACPRFRTLVKIETEFRNYLAKNKDWCGIPDEVVATVKASTEKDAGVSVKACNLAVQFKKAQEQAAQGVATAAPKLPAGPL